MKIVTHKRGGMVAYDTYKLNSSLYYSKEELIILYSRQSVTHCSRAPHENGRRKKRQYCVQEQSAVDETAKAQKTRIIVTETKQELTRMNINRRITIEQVLLN